MLAILYSMLFIKQQMNILFFYLFVFLWNSLSKMSLLSVINRNRKGETGSRKGPFYELKEIRYWVDEDIANTDFTSASSEFLLS